MPDDRIRLPYNERIPNPDVATRFSNWRLHAIQVEHHSAQLRCMRWGRCPMKYSHSRTTFGPERLRLPSARWRKEHDDAECALPLRPPISTLRSSCYSPTNRRYNVNVQALLLTSRQWPCEGTTTKAVTTYPHVALKRFCGQHVLRASTQTGFSTTSKRKTTEPIYPIKNNSAMTAEEC